MRNQPPAGSRWTAAAGPRTRATAVACDHGANQAQMKPRHWPTRVNWPVWMPCHDRTLRIMPMVREGGDMVLCPLRLAEQGQLRGDLAGPDCAAEGLADGDEAGAGVLRVSATGRA